jgi:hypothetical protein
MYRTTQTLTSFCGSILPNERDITITGITRNATVIQDDYYEHSTFILCNQPYAGQR